MTNYRIRKMNKKNKYRTQESTPSMKKNLQDLAPNLGIYVNSLEIFTHMNTTTLLGCSTQKTYLQKCLMTKENLIVFIALYSSVFTPGGTIYLHSPVSLFSSKGLLTQILILFEIDFLSCGYLGVSHMLSTWALIRCGLDPQHC